VVTNEINEEKKMLRQPPIQQIRVEEQKQFTTSIIKHIVNTTSSLLLSFSIYSIACGVTNTIQWYQAKDERGKRTLLNHLKLLSSATLFSTTGVCIYQKVALGSVSNSLIVIGLAVDAGIDFIIALHQLSTQWKNLSNLKRAEFLFHAVTKALLFCGWVSLLMGNPPVAGLFLLFAAISPYIQISFYIAATSSSSSRGMFRPSPPPAPSDFPPVQPPDGFKSFSGRSFRLGDVIN
jgi:hypothetical protein